MRGQVHNMVLIWQLAESGSETEDMWRAQGVVLAATFAVSHNVEEAKPLAAGNPATANLREDFSTRDWGVQQV